MEYYVESWVGDKQTITIKRYQPQIKEIWYEKETHWK